MPTYNVTGPDGRKYRVTAPDGATQDQIIAYAQEQATPKQAEPDAFEQTAKSDSNTQNLFAGMGGALSGIPIAVREMVGKQKPGEFQEWKDSMAGLWSTPMGKVGTVAGGVLPAIPTMMVPGLNTVAGAAAVGAGMGALQPTGDDGSRGANILVGGALGGAGQKLGNVIGGALSNRAAAKATKLTAEKADNAVRDSAIKAAQNEGFVLPPSQVNPTFANRALEGFAGKLTTAQQSSMKNQSLANNLVRSELGLPPDAPLTRETMVGIRQAAAAKGYEPLKQFGAIKADAGYAQDVLDMAQKYDKSHGGMASLQNKEVEQILRDANQAQFDSANVVEFLRNLREQGFANKGFASNAKDKVLGATQIKLANAIEDLTERNLQRAGQPDVLQNFRDARTLMAKTFTVEKAINPATGNIQSGKLAEMFRKGKPLSGGIEKVARAATAFPAAMKETTTSMPLLSPLDYMGGILTGSATGPAGLAATFARPVVRSGILSSAYQKAMVNPPKYEISSLAKLLGANKQETQELLGLLGGIGAPAGNR
jgi:hypothetical protein